MLCFSFCGIRWKALLRNRLPRSDKDPPQPPLNMYIELDEGSSQKQFEDIARSSCVDSEASYEEVPVHAAVAVLDFTYENQNSLTDYVPMGKQKSNTEITEEPEAPHIKKPNTSMALSSNDPLCVHKLTPSLNSHNCEK